MSTRFAAKPRGMTLTEVLVAAFLGVLVLYLLVSIFIPALRLSTLGATRVDLDQRAAVMMGRVTQSLRRTTRAGVTSGTVEGTHLLSVHPLVGALSGAKQQWSASLTVYSWSGKKLQERIVPLKSPPNKATILPLAELLGEGEGRILRLEIGDVQEFTAKVDSGPRVDVQLTLSKAQDTLRVQRTVFLVNSSQ